MAAVREQPPWKQPATEQSSDLPPLKIYNSLTRTKTPFIPIDTQKKNVSWYVCGPTVYDDAHLGHARNYVTTDIIRRILRDYFKFNVKFVMNITDVDDKIILRARQQHLLAELISKNSTSRNTALETSRAALKAYLAKNLTLIPSDTPIDRLEAALTQHYEQVLQGGSLDGSPPGDKEAKIKMHIKTVSTAIEALKDSDIPLDDFFAKTRDLLLPYLDSLYGHSINAQDHSIFTKLTKNYEMRFMEDIRALNCLDPDIIPRVTEYGPQIVQFIEKIQENGFAYKTSDGSVYFDVQAFETANNSYPRLEPWSRNDKGRQAEGEGALIQKTEKKSHSDFALWKSSRPGEPSWPSSWGSGRPGWHIECSAMASEAFGEVFDIHSGGIDLAFPHHDNELAQSEAYWTSKDHSEQHQWVNYFMHMGHLSIAGSKMSKSLKNFTTIREALDREDWTSRGLRIVFLLGSWREGIEVTDSVVKEGSSWEEKINNFFIKVHDILERGLSSTAKANANDSSLQPALEKSQHETYNALCDSFNTRQVMLIISDLVTTFNAVDKNSLVVEEVRSVARWITEMVQTFGLDHEVVTSAIGWSGSSIPDNAKSHVYALSNIRDQFRQKARSSGITAEDLSIASSLKPSNSTSKQEQNPYAEVAARFATSVEHISHEPSQDLSKSILALCDRLRDVDLWDKGIYLEDSTAPNEPAVVRPVTRELVAARREREDREEAKQKAKEQREKEAAAKAEKGRLSHLEMFRSNEYTGQFSEWDVDGIPTKDVEGKEVAKSKTKKLRKDWERQKKLHEAWLQSQK